MADGYYTVGNVLYLWVLVRDADGVLVDPGDLQLRVRRHGVAEEVVSLLSLTRESIGRFSYELPLTTTGVTHVRWESTSPTAADEDSFHVARSVFV
jgi:hypothetical protein